MATWSRTPLLGRADVRSGTHITSLGADEPGKAELNDDLLAASLVVTDDEQLYGDVLAKVDTTLPRLLRYERPGRTNPGQVTVYSPVGLPLQDVVAAWHAYQRARARSLAIPYRDRSPEQCACPHRRVQLCGELDPAGPIAA